MKIVPEHKQDFEACSALSTAEDYVVITQLDDLLAWLRDMNWPVAPVVEARVKTLGVALIEPVRKVLQGPDNIWKYWLVSSLLPSVDSLVVRSLRAELDKIVASPTAGEIEEGVVDAARKLANA